jgi:Kip1 ubiquitination-promoting complex protein 1
MVFQKHICDVLRGDIEGSTKLIDTMLNQLNWAFSEFVRLLQDLDEVIIRPGSLRDPLDGQKLKICATCFDICVSLLRVIEMIVSLVPELLLGILTLHSELLLHRLIQMLCQVLARVGGSHNVFDRIVHLRLPGLETVDHFPILVAVVGVLVQLVISDKGLVEQRRVLSAIVGEPGFQLGSVEFLLGQSALPSTSSDRQCQPFNLAMYKEVSEVEVQQLQQLLTLLSSQVLHVDAQDIDDELLCSICYARVKSVAFVPCQHQSCRPCITHQMMSRNECFFCKAKIDDVVDIYPAKC